jgi:SAM-dependent methyltransferase
MRWKIKGAIQSVLSWLPAGDQLHYVLQRHAGGLKNFDRECDIKVQDYLLMVKHLRSAGFAVEGCRLLEIGTGWYPTFPFCLYLVGAQRVHTLDLRHHLKADLTLACAKRLATHVQLIAEVSGVNAVTTHAKQRALVSALEKGASIEQATQGVVNYAAPADAAQTSLADDSVDVVFSNSVLEHVPGPVIERFFAEARRILRSGGVVFHSVNCGDHYAYVDKTIHQLNYLQYSEAQWQPWNNQFLYQNRLRAPVFTHMAREAGFLIELDTSHPHPQRLKELAGLQIHADFAHYTPEQLALTSIDFIGRNPG